MYPWKGFQYHNQHCVFIVLPLNPVLLHESVEWMNWFVCCQVSNKDMEHVNIIAFRQRNQVEITGSVTTSHEFISTLKVS